MEGNKAEYFSSYMYMFVTLGSCTSRKMPGFSSVGTFKIFIGNLADKTSNADIKPLFEKYGKVVECDVVKNYGFVVSVVSTESNTSINIINGNDYQD